MRNTADDSGKKPADFGIAQFTEAQRVHRTDRPSAHGENVANDSADSGGRALEWFDGAWMVVRFDLEGDCQAVTNINDTGVFFTSADQDFRRFRREEFQDR